MFKLLAARNADVQLRSDGEDLRNYEVKVLSEASVVFGAEAIVVRTACCSSWSFMASYQTTSQSPSVTLRAKRTATSWCMVVCPAVDHVIFAAGTIQLLIWSTIGMPDPASSSSCVGLVRVGCGSCPMKAFS